MLYIKKVSLKKTSFIILLFLFLIPTILDSYVNSKRLNLWEPDDASHYVLKKTQLENCLFTECEFNKNAENLIKSNFLNDDRIIKRTLLDYHPAYSLAFLILEKLSFDKYDTFKILNYFGSFLMIYFALRFYRNHFKSEIIQKNSIILTLLLFIFLTFTLTIWRDAFKLNFGIFIYLLDKIINFHYKKKKFKFYIINIFQIFIHPAGIICSFVIVFAQWLLLINYKIKNIFNIKEFYKEYFYFIFSLFVLIFYYFNGLKYINLDISIANVYTGDLNNIFILNFLSFKNYLISFNGIIFIILALCLVQNKIVVNKIFIIILLIIIFVHFFNPSPNKEIIYIFDFYLKFLSSILLFEIYLNRKQKINLYLFILICIIQTFYLGKEIKTFINVRPILDNLNYSNSVVSQKLLLDKNKLIIFEGDNDYILYNYLNQNLLNNKIYYTGFSDKKIKDVLNEQKEFYLIFDLFNNNFDIIKKKKVTGRSFSRYLNQGDKIKVVNKNSKNIKLQLLPYSDGKVIIEDKIIQFYKNQILIIEIPQKTSKEIKFEKIKKFVEILSLSNNENNYLSLPWKSNVTLELYSSYHKQSIILDFSEINLNKNCKIKKILNDKFQDIYAEAVCK